MSQIAFDHGSGQVSGEPVMIPAHPFSPTAHSATFFQSLLDNLAHGIVFLDTECRITSWNIGMEHLTGLGNSVIGRRFSPALLQLRDLQGEQLRDVACPFHGWMQTRASGTEQYVLTGRSGREIQVELNFHPVLEKDGQLVGATVIIIDTSAQLELQKQLNDLYAIAVLDPLTQVSNRAEFERLLHDYVRTHLAVGLKCSIIITDIDFFKQINDNFGHHVGDQALISFAQHIKNFVRNHDFVARYGGEEFVILCANCDEAAAVQRAEEIRASLAVTKQPMLGEKCISASFGVSELVPNDSATDFFVRADHALLKAKELGRNRVVAFSSMSSPKQQETKVATLVSTASGISWRPLVGEPLLGEEYIVNFPMPIMLEKLRGFIEEVNGDLFHVEDGFVAIKIAQTDPTRSSRKVKLVLELDLTPAEKVPEKTQREFPSANLFIRVAVFQEISRWSGQPSPAAAEKLLRNFLSLTMLASPEFHIKRPEMATQKRARY